MNIKLLKELVLQPCQNVINIPYKTTNYKDIIKLWREYKYGNLDPDLVLLNRIFLFRDRASNHALIYSSSLIEDSVLLLGKINNKYISVKLPRYGLQNRDFVAVYVKI